MSDVTNIPLVIYPLFLKYKSFLFLLQYHLFSSYLFSSIFNLQSHMKKNSPTKPPITTSSLRHNKSIPNTNTDQNIEMIEVLLFSSNRYIINSFII